MYEERRLHILLAAWLLHIEQGIVSDIHIVVGFYYKGIAIEDFIDQFNSNILSRQDNYFR